MKHIKLFENFNDNDIDSITPREMEVIRLYCKKWDIENYTINEDGSIDVHGNVSLSLKRLNRLPIKFRNVDGDFDCSNNKITSLEGCPESVVNFYCSNNQLTSLEGCPQHVDGDFSCYNNHLISLEGCPESIGRNFNCQDNQLTSLEGCPQRVPSHFSCGRNQIISFEFAPLSVGGNFHCLDNPVEVVWNLFNDYSKVDMLNDYDPIRDDKVIILDRLNAFLQDIGKPTVTEVRGYKCI